MKECCNEKRGTMKKVLYLWIIIALPIISIGGVSSYPVAFRYPAIVSTLILIASFILFIKRRVPKDRAIGYFFLLLGVLLLSTLMSLELDLSMKILLTYCCGVMLVCLDLPKDVFEKTLKVMEIVCLVMAATIILSVFIDNFVLTYLAKLVDPRGTGTVAISIYKEITYSHSYSGLAREKAEAAYIMNVGIALVLSRLYSGKKMGIWGYVELVIFLLGLIFANKRMLFIVPLLCYIVFTFLQRKKGKITSLLLTVAGGLAVFFILAEFIPQINNIIERFSSSSGEDILTGRAELWKYSLEMFAKNPLFGSGFASFNEYSFRNGYFYNGGKWNFYGHNCYLELLGELGIIGSIIFWCAFLSPLFWSMKLLRNRMMDTEGKFLLLFSLYVQIMFLFYSLTGNVVYYQDQIMLWMFAVSMALFVKRNTDQSKR